MKKHLPAFTVALCAVVGVLRIMDLVLFTDHTTGFLTLGSVWPRYAVIALLAVLCFFSGRSAPVLCTHAPYENRGGSALCAALGFLLIISAVWQIIDMFTSGADIALHQLCAPLYLLFGLWLLTGFTNRSPADTTSTVFVLWGAVSSVCFCLLAVERFISAPSSLHRIAQPIGIFSAVGGMLFSCMLVQGLHYTRLGAAPCRRLASTGLLCFLLCTCLGLPQAVANVFTGGSIAECLLDICLAMLGIYGAFQAVMLTRYAVETVEPAASEPDAPTTPKPL